MALELWFNYSYLQNQTYEDGSLKAAAHASLSLLPTEKRYSQIEIEALAIIFVKQNSISLHMEEDSDCRKITARYCRFWIADGIPTHTANRLLSWRTILLNFDFLVFVVEKIGTCRWFVKINIKIQWTIRKHRESSVKSRKWNKWN